MKFCNYIQSLFGIYLAATDTLKYDIIYSGESLTIIVGGITLLLLQPSEWKEPIMYGVGSHISSLKTAHGYEYFIVYIRRFDEDLPGGEYNGELDIHVYYV